MIPLHALAMATSPFLAGLTDLRRSPLQLPHYVAVRGGLRPALDDWIPVESLAAFEDLLARHGLLAAVDCVFEPLEEPVVGGPDVPTTSAGGRRYEASGVNGPDDRVHVVVARTPAATARALAACWYSLAVGGRHVRKPIVDHGRFGEALGYPACCVRAFLRNSDWQRSSLIAAAAADGSRRATANTLTKRTPWMVSNHIPCSFGCSETIELVAATLGLLDMEDPDYARSVRDVLSQPVLAMSEVRMYSLWAGGVHGDGPIRYDEVLPLGGDAVDAADVELLTWADAVSVEDGNVVLRRGTEIEVIPTCCDRGVMEVPVLLDWHRSGTRDSSHSGTVRGGVVTRRAQMGKNTGMSEGDAATQPAAEHDSDEREEDAVFARTVGRRLRAIRQAQGLSLAHVESRSGGRWSSSAIGAYERGFRNLSLPRLRALAEFYRVPVSVLLGEPGPFNAPPERKKIVLSLEALRTVDPAEPVQRFVQSIISARGDFNGKVLSLRYDDLKALCTLVGGDIPTGVAQLRSWGILLDGPAMEVTPDVLGPTGPEADSGTT